MRFALLYLSLRYWLRHRSAFALASVGVALGIAVFVAIQIANASVLGAFSASLDSVAGRATLQIRGGASGLPDALFSRISREGLVAAPQLSRTVWAPSLNTTILLSGVDVFSEIPFRPRDLSGTPGDGRTTNARDQGGAIEFLLRPNAVALSESLAKKGALKVGDDFPVLVGAQTKNLRVVAILRDEAAGRAFGGDYALMDIAGAQETFNQLGKISEIDLLVPENQIETVAAWLRNWAPPDATVARPAGRGEQVGAMLGAFQLSLTALSSIAAFVGAFLIYNALASAVVRRRGEAGILRAVGASSRQITALFLIEAAFIGAFGAIIGYFLGILLAKWTLGAVATTVSQLYLAVKARELFVPFWLFPLSLGAGTVLSVLAAILPAREAASVSPRRVLNVSSLHTALEKNANRLLIGGVVLVALALFLCWPRISGQQPLLGFVAAGATLAGFALLVPRVLLFSSRFLRPFAQKLGGVEGALAADNLRRALNRSSLVIAALLVCLALTTGMNVMVQSFRGTVGEWIDGTIAADLFVAPPDGFSGEPGPGLPLEVAAFARSQREVQVVDVVRRASVEIENQPVELLANDLPSLERGPRRLRFVATENDEAQALRDYQSGRAILVSERLSNLLKLAPGQNLRVPTPRGARDFRIAGVFYDYTPGAVFYLARPKYREIWRDDAIDGLALYLENGTSGQQMKTRIEKRFGAKYSLLLLPNREIRQQVFDTFDQTFAVTYALQLIALVVAAIGVFDTLVAMTLERTVETASLRAMGASRFQVQKIALWEFGLLGFLGWILGMGAGILLAGQMIFVINKQFFGWTIFPLFPIEAPLSALLLALCAALGAGIFPAKVAARRDLATALLRE